MEDIDKNIIDKVKNIYFDVEKGQSSDQNIYQNLNKSVKLKDIKLILKNIEINQIKDKNIPKKKLYIPIVQVPNSYQIDLTFFDQYAKNNNGYHILLTIINMNSKYVYVYPMKNKETNTIIAAMKNFIDNVNDIKIMFI